MVLQLLLSIRTLRGFLRLPVLGSHVDPLEGKAGACGSGSGLACVSLLGSVLLLNDDGDMVVVVLLFSVQRVKDDSSATFFSCAQATLWFLLSWAFGDCHPVYSQTLVQR